MAIQSMDLVYSLSDYPLGLLSVVIESQLQLEYLLGLLREYFVVKHTHPSYPALKRAISSKIAFEVVQLLKLITSDRRWDRAWIF